VPKYVIDRGLESWTAATILSLIGLFNIFGSLTSGYLSSIMSKKIILVNVGPNNVHDILDEVRTDH